MSHPRVHCQTITLSKGVLNMMIVDEKREELISDLKLNESLRRLTSGEFVHNELEFRCLKIKYSLEPEDFSPTGLNVVPLWESDRSITGFYLNEKGDPVFIHYYIEDIDDYKVIGSSVGKLVDFLIEEYVDYEFEDEVRKLLLQED